MFNPSQPRDSHGRFGEIAGEALSALASAAGSGGSGLLANIVERYKVFKPGPHLETYHDDPSVPHLGAEMWSLHRNALGGKKDFTTGQKAALISYSGFSYRGLQEGLRKAKGGVPENLRQWVGNLDTAISAGKMPYDVLLHRGVGSLVNNMAQIGSTIHDFGYQSATMNSSYADMFRKKPRNAGGALLHMLVKKGATGLPLDKLSSMPEEYEVLFPRGSRYKVLHRHEDHIFAELL